MLKQKQSYYFTVYFPSEEDVDFVGYSPFDNRPFIEEFVYP
jgi:hypothetical protein